MGRPQRRATCFPYTTLFRSERDEHGSRQHRARDGLEAARGGVAIGPEAGDQIPGPLPGEEAHRQREEVAVEIALEGGRRPHPDRKSTRLNSSHVETSYAVFC